MILVVNAGSTSLKLRLVGEDESVEALDGFEQAVERATAGDVQTSGSPAEAAGPSGAQTAGIGAVAHRVVHGGSSFRDPVLIDEAVAEQIFALEELAPLHNAPALRAIEASRRAFPGLPHVAVFDTGFHKTMLPEAAVYPLPYKWRELWGVRRYGFHGLSLQWCAERVPALLGRPAEGLRLVVCHLGGGCSVNAIRDGRSLDTTMGFSPLEGVPMATRSGSIDPGALLYSMHTHGLSSEQAEHALNFDSGLHGLADGGESAEGVADDGHGRDWQARHGESARRGGGAMRAESAVDVASIERRALAGEPEARLAIDVFCHRLAGAVAAMAASCGGIDALAFTAGIGEGSAHVRAQVCRRLAFLGVELDEARNAEAFLGIELDETRKVDTPGRAPDADRAPDRVVSAERSGVAVAIVAAKEEIVAARAARKLLGESAPSG